MRKAIKLTRAGAEIDPTHVVDRQRNRECLQKRRKALKPMSAEMHDGMSAERPDF